MKKIITEDLANINLDEVVNIVNNDQGVVGGTTSTFQDKTKKHLVLLRPIDYLSTTYQLMVLSDNSQINSSNAYNQGDRVTNLKDFLKRTMEMTNGELFVFDTVQEFFLWASKFKQ